MGSQCYITKQLSTSMDSSKSNTSRRASQPSIIPSNTQYLEVPHNTRRRLSSTSSLASDSSTFYGTPREHIQHEGMLEALDKIEDEMVKLEETDEDWEYKKRMDLAQ